MNKIHTRDLKIAADELSRGMKLSVNRSERMAVGRKLLEAISVLEEIAKPTKRTINTKRFTLLADLVGLKAKAQPFLKSLGPVYYPKKK